MPVKKCVSETEDIFIVTMKFPKGEVEANGVKWALGSFIENEAENSGYDVFENEFHVELTNNGQQLDCWEAEQNNYKIMVMLNRSAMTEDRAIYGVEEELDGANIDYDNVEVSYYG